MYWLTNKEISLGDYNTTFHIIYIHKLIFSAVREKDIKLKHKHNFYF